MAGPAYGPNLRRRDSFLEPSCDDHSVDLPCILSLADRLCDDVQLFCGQMGCHRACDNKLANSYRHNGKRMSTTGFRANGHGMNIYIELHSVRSLLREHRSQACPTTKRIETNFLETGRCEKKAPLPPDSKLKIGHRSLQKLSGAFFSHRHPTSPSSTLKSRGRRGGLFFRTNRYPIWRSALLTMVANTH